MPFACTWCRPGRGFCLHNRHDPAPHAAGGRFVDYTADGRPIGIEIVSPTSVQLADLNSLPDRLGFARLAREDLAPLVAA